MEGTGALRAGVPRREPHGPCTPPVPHTAHPHRHLHIQALLAGEWVLGPLPGLRADACVLGRVGVVAEPGGWQMEDS